ncbi:hypothetical protein ACWGB8_24925 [Kitasatospora sp. NPDC054939]
MNRLTMLAAGVAGAATLFAAPVAASAATVGTSTTTATTVTCGNSGLQSGLMTRVCAEVTGDGVQFYGNISLAGPPSPGGPMPQPKQLLTTLSAEVVGGASIGTSNQNVLFTTTPVKVTGVGGTVPCGSTVRATFSVVSFGWYPAPVTVEVPVTC